MTSQGACRARVSWCGRAPGFRLECLVCASELGLTNVAEGSRSPVHGQQEQSLAAPRRRMVNAHPAERQ